MERVRKIYYIITAVAACLFAALSFPVPPPAPTTQVTAPTQVAPTTQVTTPAQAATALYKLTGPDPTAVLTVRPAAQPLDAASHPAQERAHGSRTTPRLVSSPSLAAPVGPDEPTGLAPSDIRADGAATELTVLKTSEKLPDPAAQTPDPEADERATITLAFRGLERVYRDELLPEPDHTVTIEFHERRINAPYAEKLRCVEECLASGASPKAALLYCFPLLARTVDEFIAAADRPCADATMEFRPYASPKFTITREKIGYSISRDRLYFDIYNALRKGRDVRVEAYADVLAPTVTAEKLATYTVRRSTFSTDYSRSGENRKHNIRLALSRINGTRLDTGESFSFNEKVGRRTAAGGFAEAKIILDGEYVDGVGGGVCQASTTLYNAALCADMTITGARSHSLPPSYVPPSFDAMVNSGTSDLTFRNDGDGPVFIAAYGTDDKAVVEFYGEKLPYRIVRESKVISRSAVPEDKVVVDSEFKYVTEEMASGETVRVSYGAAGLTSEGYLDYYDADGKLIERKQIRRDVYRSVRGIIAVKP